MDLLRLAALVSVAEAVVLPITSGAAGDDPATWGTQAGTAAAEIIVASGTTVAVESARGRTESSAYDIGRRKEFTTARREAMVADEAFAEGADKALLVFMGLLSVIQTLASEYFNGFGLPDPGRTFQDRGTTFANDISNLLAGASPTHWSGAGADEYKQRNDKQLSLIPDLAAADQRVAGILKTQADQVEQGRQAFAAVRLSAIGAWGCAIVIYRRYVVTQAAGQAFEAAAIAASLMHFTHYIAALSALISIIIIITLYNSGRDNKHHLNHAIETYQKIVDESPSPDADVRIKDNAEQRYPKKAAASS